MKYVVFIVVVIVLGIASVICINSLVDLIDDWILFYKTFNSTQKETNNSFVFMTYKEFKKVFFCGEDNKWNFFEDELYYNGKERIYVHFNFWDYLKYLSFLKKRNKLNLESKMNRNRVSYQYFINNLR